MAFLFKGFWDSSPDPQLEMMKLDLRIYLFNQIGWLNHPLVYGFHSKLFQSYNHLLTFMEMGRTHGFSNRTFGKKPKPRQTNIATENGPFQDVFAIEHGDIPLLC